MSTLAKIPKRTYAPKAFLLDLKLGLFVCFLNFAFWGYVIHRRYYLVYNSYDKKFEKTVKPTILNRAIEESIKPTILESVKNPWWSVVDGLKDTPLSNFDWPQNFVKDDLRLSKVILRVGNESFAQLNWTDGSDQLWKKYCPVTNCVFTSNWSSFETADALIISEFDEAEGRFFVQKPKKQVWIALHLEPPLRSRVNTNLLNDMINWTASYRRDSTFTIPYYFWSEVDQSVTSRTFPRKNYAHGRRKKVAMFVSNCHDTNGRLAYAAELNKSISVDIYGKCGSLECPKLAERNSCFQMLKRDYKFYLSFENSNCFYYVTDKLHRNALQKDVIPIVMGARKEDYAFVAPPGSYIHVDDFESPHHLGEYLNLLDNNDKLYNEYFRYKGRFSMLNQTSRNDVYWCQLCIRLHLMDYVNVDKWHDDYDTWWNDVCATRSDGNYPWKTWKEST